MQERAPGAALVRCGPAMTPETPPPDDAARQERVRELMGGPLVLAPARARAFL